MAVSRAARWLVGVALGAIAIGALPAAVSAATVSGTVTGAPGAVALEGVEVCSHVNPYDFEDTCAQTDSGGHYALAGLPAGEYSIHFSDRERNRNYVDQYYDGGFAYPGTRITVGGSENRTGIDVELPAGSSISGTVTDVDTGLPIAGIFACPFAEVPGYQRCDETGPDGKYQANGLPPTSYRVEFQSGLLNYQEQELPPIGEPKIVISAANEAVGPIDAAMKVGAEISGTVREAGTGKPVANLFVELIHPAPKGGEGNRIAFTDASGHYTFRALPEDDDIIVFSPPSGPFGTSGGFFATQYYKGSATLAGATILHAVPGTSLTGIDGEVVNLNPPKAPVTVSLLPAPRLPRHKPLRCHRGFKKRKVHGKPHCVKVHKHRRRHRHGG